MKKPKKKIWSHVLNIVTIALIVECFLCSILAVRMYARESCFERAEETTTQIAQMFSHAMDERRDKLTVFADILAANSENPDALLQTYMETFCRTQYFSAICVHRADGSSASYGNHPHDLVEVANFSAEVERLPYVSEVFAFGDKPSERFVYQAVPIVRSGKTIAVLYGYMSLDTMLGFVTSTAYDGNCRFYIVDGQTGDLLMDKYNPTLGNIFDGSMGYREVRDGYDMEQLHSDVQNGNRGFFVFRAVETGPWIYACYMPVEINNWSMHLLITEPQAFASYNEVSSAMVILMVCVIALMFIHVIALMLQNARTNKLDKQRLHKSGYINAVQRALLSAHNNPDFVDQALKTIANEMAAETVLLLSFSGKTISNAQYWPSKDKPQAMDMVGRNMQDDFPMLFDLLAANESIAYDGNDPSLNLSQTAAGIFKNHDVSNIVLVPITDNAGILRGTIAAVNMAKKLSAEMLECVTYDFFMAITNLENHNIIKRMGAMDYLTGIKNRNSYEAEIGSYTTAEADTLWCVFIDVNGLHEINNTQGHKAGDVMLCAVADSVKRVFGEQNAYRLGGDEFVAFAMGGTYAQMLKKKTSVIAELAAKKYSVSIGFAGTEKNAHGIFEVQQILSQAESIMYKEKWEYYQNHSLASDRGHFSAMPDTGMNG